MHKFHFKPDDLFINRLKTYQEYNVFIYQGQMFSNKESRLKIGSAAVSMFDINRSRTENLIYPSFMVARKGICSSLKYANRSLRTSPSA